MKLIDKDALVAEIKRLLAFYSKEIEDNKEDPWAMDIAKRDILQEMLSFIDTLEVKEVDLEKNSLTWKDINLIDHLLFDIKEDYDNGKLDKEKYYKEVLKKFKARL